MPKFMITVIVFAVIFWIYAIFLVTNTPTDLLNILRFLVIIFISLSLTFSVPAYFFVRKKHSEKMDQRQLYRKSFKWSMFVSFGIAGFLLLKAFQLLNLMNSILFVVFYIASYTQLRTKR